MITFRFPGGGIFSPSVEPTPEPVDREAIADEARRERERELRLRRGRRDTILTSPVGVLENQQDANVRRPSLLGE